MLKYFYTMMSFSWVLKNIEEKGENIKIKNKYIKF